MYTPQPFSESLPNSIGTEEDTDARFAYEFEQLKSPLSGEIPWGIREREREFVAGLPTRNSMWLAKQTPGNSILQLGTSWDNYGFSTVGGRARSVKVDVSNANVLLVATVGGGVFRSTNKGTDWRKTTSPADIHSATCLAQDTRSGKEQTWYHGSGEYNGTGGYPTYNSHIGEGIFKSTDGGASWAIIPSTKVARFASAKSPFNFVHTIVCDASRNDSDIVYAACFGAIMRSNDGGATWRQVLGGGSSPWTDVAIGADGMKYAVLQSTSSRSGVWRSKDGLTWQKISNTSNSFSAPLTSRCVLASAPSNPYLLYLMANTTFSATVHRCVIKPDDTTSRAASWVAGTSSGDFINTQGGYNMSLSIHPEDDRYVLAGGTNLIRSTDGFISTSLQTRVGGYLVSMSGSDPVSPDGYLWKNHHPDIHFCCFDPSNPNRVYNANDGGVFVTEDITADEVEWKSLNMGVNAAQFYSVGIDPVGENDNTVIGGAQDNSTGLSFGKGQTMEYILGADGMYCDVAAKKASYYPSFQSGQFYRVTVRNGAVDSISYIRPGIQASYGFVAPMQADPNNTNSVYFISNQHLILLPNVYRVQAYKYRKPWTTQLQTNSIAFRTIITNQTNTAVGVSKTPANIVYVGSNSGAVRVYERTATDSLRFRRSANVASSSYINCVTVNPTDANNAVAVASNYEVRSVWETTDGGTSWKDVSGNIEENPNGSGSGPACKWIDIAWYKGKKTYLLGTTSGLFTTDTLIPGGTVWVREGLEAIGNVHINQIRSRSSDGFVAIATHGRGIFTTYLQAPTSVQSNNASLALSTPNLYPNPSSDYVVVHYATAAQSRTTISAYSLRGERFELFNSNESSGEHSHTLPVHALPQGAYYLRVQSGNAVQQASLNIVR